MKKNSFKNEILQMDLRDIVNILSKNIFLILFFTLLGLIIGYFNMNKDTGEQQFATIITISEAHSETKEILRDISDSLYRISRLEKEKAFIQFLFQTNTNLPINSDYPVSLKTKDDYVINSTEMNKTILDYTRNSDLYDETILAYNEKVIKDFPDYIDQEEYIIDDIPTYASLKEEIGRRSAISVKLVFTQKYSDYLVENFVKIYLNNINNHLSDAVSKKIDKIFTSFAEDRSLVEGFLKFTLNQYPKELHYFIENFPDFDSKNQFGKNIEESGIYENKIDLFQDSSNIDESFNNKYRTVHITQDNSGIAWFGILGFLIGAIISFASTLYYKKNRNVK